VGVARRRRGGGVKSLRLPTAILRALDLGCHKKRRQPLGNRGKIGSSGTGLYDQVQLTAHEDCCMLQVERISVSHGPQASGGRPRMRAAESCDHCAGDDVVWQSGRSMQPT
jgi:hypothetical protein